MKPTVSIVYVAYAKNEARSELSKRLLKKLEGTLKNYPAELIVVDDGDFREDSLFYLKEAMDGRITTYVRNSENLWYGNARNQGVGVSLGDYICIMDNDIEVEDGWIEECMDIITKVEGYFITPVGVDRGHNQSKYFRNPVVIDGKTYQVNAMAGASCWIMPKKVFQEIGKFPTCPRSGSIWGREAARKYPVILLPTPKAHNLGNWGSPYAGVDLTIKKNENIVEVKKHFTNGEYIDFNV